MSGARAKTINLLLHEGDLNGVITLEDSSWNSGELYSAPRSSVEDLIASEACNKYGVYLLLSPETVYIGQSSDLAKRITQHTVGKDWWESVVILTTKDDSLNHADIDFLESVLIDKASKIKRLDCENRTKGNPVKVDKFRQVYLGQYLEEALFLMQLIGITVFSESPQGHKSLHKNISEKQKPKAVDKGNHTSDQEQTEQKQKSYALIAESMKIGAFVQKYVVPVIADENFPASELQHLQSLDYCKKTFRTKVYYPILLEWPEGVEQKELICSGGNNRYYTDVIIHRANRRYLVSSQWYRETYPYLISWLSGF